MNHYIEEFDEEIDYTTDLANETSAGTPET